jgi:UDP-N-acetyl-D-galactosamine dehydrogenase
VATEVVKLMMRKDLKVIDSKVLILGFTFKEDCPDVRNTRVIDIYDELKSFDVHVDVYDPWVNGQEVKRQYGIEIQTNIEHKYSAVVFAVAHNIFNKLAVRELLENNGVVYDVKGVLAKDKVDSRL